MTRRGLGRGLVVVLAIAGCKQRTQESEAAATPSEQAGPAVGAAVTSVQRRPGNTMYAVAMAAGEKADAAEKGARAKGIDVMRGKVSDVFNDGQVEFLTSKLAPADAAAIRSAAVVLELHAAGADAMKNAVALAETTRDVAAATDGWVLDPEEIRIDAAPDFARRLARGHADVRTLIMVHAMTGGGTQPFLDTAGLHRYGFPELYVAEASAGDVNQMIWILNGVAQKLLDGGGFDARGEITIDFRATAWDVGIGHGGTGRATLRARWAREVDAGADDPLVIELRPTAGERLEDWKKLIADCFGAGAEEVATVKDDDPEILAAAAHARADLAKERAHYAHGVPIGERLGVKAKFTDDKGQVEWMWVDVVAFHGDTFEGTLANEPEIVQTLRNGQKVSVKLADVGDYLHEAADGTKTGGYSIEVFRKRGLYTDK